MHHISNNPALTLVVTFITSHLFVISNSINADPSCANQELAQFEALDKFSTQIINEMEIVIKIMKLDHSMHLAIDKFKSTFDKRKELLQVARKLQHEYQALREEYGYNEVNFYLATFLLPKFFQQQSELNKLRNRRKTYFKQQTQLYEETSQAAGEIIKSYETKSGLVDTLSLDFEKELLNFLSQLSLYSSNLQVDYNSTKLIEVDELDLFDSIVFNNVQLTALFIQAVDKVLDNLKEIRIVYSKLNNFNFFDYSNQYYENGAHYFQNQTIKTELKKIEVLLLNIVEISKSARNVFGSISLLDFMNGKSAQLNEMINSIVKDATAVCEQELEVTRQIRAGIMENILTGFTYGFLGAIRYLVTVYCLLFVYWCSLID